MKGGEFADPWSILLLVAISWSVLQLRGRFCCLLQSRGRLIFLFVFVARPWSVVFLLQIHGRSPLFCFLFAKPWSVMFLLQIHGRSPLACYLLQHHGRLRARTNTCSFLFNHPREDFTLLSYPYFLCYRDPIYLHVNLISLPFKAGKAHVLCLKAVYSSCVPHISHSNKMNNVATYAAVILKIA